MRSFFVTALCLSLIHTSVARVPHSFRDLIGRNIESGSEQQHEGFFQWFARLFKRQTAAEGPNDICYEDVYYEFVGGLGPEFCTRYMHTPNVTTTVDYTPTSTYTSTFSTRVGTTENLSRVTASSTVTVTVTPGTAKAKRNAEPQITAMALSPNERHKVFQKFRRQNGMDASSTDNEASMASAFSSACSCQDYPGPTVTATYTDDPTVETLLAFGRSTTTVYRTTSAAARVATTTVTARPSTSAGSSSLPSDTTTTESSGTETGTQTSTSSSGAATPTAPPFTCPEDNNTVVSQMIGNERFDYRVLCDTVLMDSNLYNGPLSYNSFGECAGACSVANANFSYPVCMGVSYDLTGGGPSGTCYLKSSNNLTISTSDFDSALLVSIVLGYSNTSTAGTTTESAPFSGETLTQDPAQISSSMHDMLSDSSFTMPMITPYPLIQSGMMVNAPGALYSTYVSAGSTFSTGTAYTLSTQYANGSWYATYFSSWSVAWTTATSVYAAQATGGYTISNSTNSETQQQTGPNGEYSNISWSNSTTYGGGFANVTAIMSNQTYDANGTEIYSSATTLHYSYATGSAENGSGAGGPSGVASGGASGGGAGAPASGAPITSTSVFSTETVIVNSGGFGGSAGGVASGVAPSTSATVIINSFGTAYSTGYAASGGPTGISGGSGGVASGGPSSSPTSPVSVVTNSFGTGGVASGAASGGPTGTGGANSSDALGGPSTSTPFSNTNDLRSGTDSSSAPIATGSLSIPVFNSTGGGYTAPAGTSSGTAPVSSAPETSSTPFSNTDRPRSGTYDTSSIPLGTAPAGTGSPSPSGPLSTGPSPYLSSNEATSAQTGTAPTALPGTAPGTGLSGYPAPSGTSSGSFSDTGVPRSRTLGTSSAPSNTTAPSTSGTAPASASGTAPSGTSSSRPPRHHGPNQPLPPPSTSLGTAPLNTGTSPGTAPLGTGTSSVSVSIPEAPRSGTISTTLSGTAPPLSTLPGTIIPPTTCANMTMGTTTLFVTTTVLGCDSTCVPWGGYGGPHSFGPPVWATGT